MDIDRYTIEEMAVIYAAQRTRACERRVQALKTRVERLKAALLRAHMDGVMI